MKKLILLFFLYYNYVNAQQFYWIATPTVISQNAGPVQAITSVTFGYWTTVRSHSVTIDTTNKKANLISCYFYDGISPAFSYIKDTVNLGGLTVGNYTLNYTVFVSWGNSHPTCVPFDTTANSYPFYSLSTNIQKQSTSRQFEISPNPISDILKINLYNNGTVLKKVIITNILGNKVLEINDPTLNSNIDTSSLPKGLYLLTLYTDKTSFTEKIIKQ